MAGSPSEWERFPPRRARLRRGDRGYGARRRGSSGGFAHISVRLQNRTLVARRVGAIQDGFAGGCRVGGHFGQIFRRGVLAQKRRGHAFRRLGFRRWRRDSGQDKRGGVRVGKVFKVSRSLFFPRVLGRSLPVWSGIEQGQAGFLLGLRGVSDETGGGAL